MMSNVLSHVIFFLIPIILITKSYAVSDESAQGFGGSNDPLEIKSGDMAAEKRPNFFVGSRYGRSSSPQLYTSKTRRLNVSPRNDRFFLGSRYGKRSDDFLAPSSSIDDELEMSFVNQNQRPVAMSCIYTGIKNYYRCNNMDEVNNLIEKFTKMDDKRK